jgi:hypothetical protein
MLLSNSKTPEKGDRVTVVNPGCFIAIGTEGTVVDTPSGAAAAFIVVAFDHFATNNSVLRDDIEVIED